MIPFHIDSVYLIYLIFLESCGLKISKKQDVFVNQQFPQNGNTDCLSSSKVNVKVTTISKTLQRSSPKDMERSKVILIANRQGNN